MGRFLLGVLLGVLGAVAYVRLDLAMPGWLGLPDRLKGNVVATAVEAELYDLDAEPAQRRRALEIFLGHRAEHAARLDADSGHPFLKAIHRARAVREARELLAQWRAFDDMLSRPALRETLERRFGTISAEDMKRRLLDEALDKRAFLKRWLSLERGVAGAADPLSALRAVAAN